LGKRREIKNGFRGGDGTHRHLDAFILDENLKKTRE